MAKVCNIAIWLLLFFAFTLMSSADRALALFMILSSLVLFLVQLSYIGLYIYFTIIVIIMIIMILYNTALVFAMLLIMININCKDFFARFELLAGPGQATKLGVIVTADPLTLLVTCLYSVLSQRK